MMMRRDATHSWSLFLRFFFNFQLHDARSLAGIAAGIAAAEVSKTVAAAASTAAKTEEVGDEDAVGVSGIVPRPVVKLVVATAAPIPAAGVVPDVLAQVDEDGGEDDEQDDDEDEEPLSADPQDVHPASDANAPAANTPATPRMLPPDPSLERGRRKLAKPRRGTTAGALGNSGSHHCRRRTGRAPRWNRNIAG